MPIVVLNPSQIMGAIDDTSWNIMDRADVWMAEGSNWVFSKIRYHGFTLYNYDPTGALGDSDNSDEDYSPKEISGSSYLELPKRLRNPSKCIINIKNDKDEKCFLWCHIRSINRDVRNPNRITKKDKAMADTLNYEGITFPVTLGQIPKIEENNDIKVNVNKFLKSMLNKEDSTVVG